MLIHLLQVGEVLDTLDAMARDFFEWLPVLAVGALVFAAFWIAAGAVRRGVRGVMERTGRPVGVIAVVSRLSRWTVLFAGLMVSLAVISPGMGAGELVQLLGIGSVAIGFAFKDILQNFLAGILILLNEPFRIGDQIVAGDHEGTVEEVETRATALRTYDGRRVVIPNGKLYTQAVVVNTAYDLRRSQYDFGIDYDDDVQLAHDLLEETLREVDGIVDDPEPQVFVWELGGSSVNLRARWWTRPSRSSIVEVQGRVIQAVKEKFDAGGIDFPYPIRDVRITEREVVEAPESAPEGEGDGQAEDDTEEES